LIPDAVVIRRSRFTLARGSAKSACDRMKSRA
jgi:hypothetical protein